MFKFVATVFAAVMAVASAAPKPGVLAAPVAYSSTVVGAPVVSAYSAPVVSAYSAPVVSAYNTPLVSAYSAPVVSGYGAAPLAYSAYGPAYYG